MKKQPIDDVRRAIQTLEETIKKTRKEWDRELRRTKELLRKLDAPD